MTEHIKTLCMYAFFFALLYLGIEWREFLTMYQVLMWALVWLLIASSLFAAGSESIKRDLVEADKRTGPVMSAIYWALKLLLASATALSGSPVLAAMMVIAFAFTYGASRHAVNSAKESK